MPGKSLVPWWLLLALCVLAGAGPAVAAVPTDPGTLAGLSGSVDYRLPAAAAAEDGAGGAWRVEKLEFTVDFDADPARTDLVEFAVRRQADDFEVIFTGADQSPVQEVDLETNFLSIRALTLMPGGGLAFVEITGRFTGPAAESFEADFTLNLDMATTVVRPVDPLTLTAGGVTEDPFAAYRVQRNAGEPEAAVREGRSIHAGTGNLFRAERDVPPAGPGGLAFTRYYNSRSPLAGEAGWLHTYAAFIDFAVEGVERGVLMIRPDGEALLFYRTDSGALAERPDEIPADVPAVPTARYPLAPVAGGEGWRFRNDRGGVEYYDDSGRLLRIVDRNGFTRTVERDAAGLITSVTGAFGRSLVFEHDVNRRLVAVTDPAGNRVTYAHDAEGRLVGVTRQDGASRRYHYGESGAPGNSLTGITDERGIRFAIWRYDTENRVVSGERAGGADRVELASPAAACRPMSRATSATTAASPPPSSTTPSGSPSARPMHAARSPRAPATPRAWRRGGPRRPARRLPGRSAPSGTSSAGCRWRSSRPPCAPSTGMTNAGAWSRPPASTPPRAQPGRPRAATSRTAPSPAVWRRSTARAPTSRTSRALPTTAAATASG